MSSKSFTVNIDILTVNTIVCHYNPHKSDKQFDFGIFMAVLVVYKLLIMLNQQF